MLFTYKTGESTAPAIVFLHGGGLSGRQWQPQMERLSDYYCLAPDLPEQGKSLHISPFRLEDAAKRVIDLIDAQVPSKRAHLVGLSLGADLALAITQIAPASINHVIVSAPAPLGKVIGKFVLALSTLPLNFLSLEKQCQATAKTLGIPEAYQATFCEDLLLAVNPTSTRHFIEALIDLPQWLPYQSEVPILVAVGEQENIIAKQAARKVLAYLKHAQGILIPRVNHVWNLQAPDLFTDTVRAWIENRPLPPVLRPLIKAKAAQ
jgi:pimeloyl-ACP methyl ester carboxylesterase